MVQTFNKKCNIYKIVFQNRFVVYRLRWFQQLIEFGFRKKNFKPKISTSKITSN